MRRRRRPAWALAPYALVWTLVWTLGCGAGDRLAPAGHSAPACADLTTVTGDLVAHASAGKLAGIGAIVRDQLDAAVMRALLRLLLDVLAALPRSSLETLGPGLGALDSDAGHALVARVIDPLVDGVHDDEVALWAIARSIGVCGDAQALQTLATLLEDARARRGVGVLLAAGTTTLDQLAAALAAAGDDGRDAFAALVGNILGSLAAPAFDPRPLRKTLVAAVDLSAGVSPTLLALVDLLDAATTRLDGTLDEQRIAGLAALAGCGRAIDPDLAVAGWLYDVVRGPGATTLGATQAPPMPLPAIDLDPVLDLLALGLRGIADSAEGRDAVAVLAMTLLAPERAALALPEIRALFGSGALASIGATLSALVSGGCFGDP